MKELEFYEKAINLREKYEKDLLKTQILGAIVKEFFENYGRFQVFIIVPTIEENYFNLPPKEIFEVLEDFGIKCSRVVCSGDYECTIEDPKFKV